MAYIHRIGRTGRAGKRGTAVTFFTEEDMPRLRPIANVIKVQCVCVGGGGGEVCLCVGRGKVGRRRRRRVCMCVCVCECLSSCVQERTLKYIILRRTDTTKHCRVQRHPTIPHTKRGRVVS